MNDRGLLGSFSTVIASMVTSVLIRCRSRKGKVVCFNHRGRLLTVVTIASTVGSASSRTIGRLEHRNVSVYVLANSKRHATLTMTKGLNVSHFVTSTLPSSGRSFVHRLRLRKGAMTVINSKVGSSRTLTLTSIDVTVKGKASVTVSMTVIALVASSLLLLPGTFGLSQRAIELVRRGLF